MWTHLTLTVHTHPAVAAVLAGSAVACRHHELPLAVCRGAVQVAGVTGDVHVVVWRYRTGQRSKGYYTEVGPNHCFSSRKQVLVFKSPVLNFKSLASHYALFTKLKTVLTE